MLSYLLRLDFPRTRLIKARDVNQIFRNYPANNTTKKQTLTQAQYQSSIRFGEGYHVPTNRIPFSSHTLSLEADSMIISMIIDQSFKHDFPKIPFRSLTWACCAGSFSILQMYLLFYCVCYVDARAGWKNQVYGMDRKLIRDQHTLKPVRSHIGYKSADTHSVQQQKSQLRSNNSK